MLRLNCMSSRGLVVNYAKNGTCIEAGLYSALYIVTCCTVRILDKDM